MATVWSKRLETSAVAASWVLLETSACCYSPEGGDDTSASSPEEPDGFVEFPEPSKRGKVIGNERAVKAKPLRASVAAFVHSLTQEHSFCGERWSMSGR